MNWDWDFVVEILPALLRGLRLTLIITFSAFGISLVLGLIVAVFRYLKIPVIAQILGFYVSFVRGTPLLVQAYFAFFVLPYYGITLDAVPTAIIVLGINYSAYLAEVFRSGIEQLPTGQWEASRALSLSTRRTWMRIVIPQAIRPIIPVLGNYLIQMFKDSAILSAITVLELLGTGLQIGSRTFRYFEPLTLVGLLFLAVSFPSSLFVRRLEKKYGTAH
ncbi:MAG TPA: ectoine/hydroxyectoine ABC transporter permease subunit EhuD [Pontimonas sp.]|nr:ectoine/hydroxyectoine ABC transporter permease subunit EhuD [Pontimonas sp.]